MASHLRVDIQKIFSSGARVEIKLDVDLTQEPVQVLFGPSGSGKSTFLRSVAGLETPERGLIQFGDQIWLDTGKSIRLRPQLRRVSYLSQKPSLFPHLSSLENILYGLDSLPPGEALQRAREFMSLLEIGALESRYPRELSGGQQQRVSLARALSVKPQLLLLDEPFSAVDQPMKHVLRLKLRELFKTLNIPVFLVTHDPIEASSLGQRVHLIDQGKILQSELSAKIFREPSSLRCAEIIGFENFLKKERFVEVIRADEVELSQDGKCRVLESISEGSFLRILLEDESGQLITSLQPHFRFPEPPPVGQRFHVNFPKNPIRFPL